MEQYIFLGLLLNCAGPTAVPPDSICTSSDSAVFIPTLSFLVAFEGSILLEGRERMSLSSKEQF